MLEKELKNIIDENQLKLKLLGTHFTLNDLKNSHVHPSLKKYVFEVIDYQLLIDKRNLEKYSHFDYSGERIGSLFNRISDEIKSNKLFTAEYISDILNRAIQFNINFLSQPNQTLLSFIYGEDKIKTSQDIFEKLRYAYYYKYISKIITTYLRKKNIERINRNDFSFLLKRIDTINKNVHQKDVLLSAVNSITNFFGQSTKWTNQFPFEAFQLFLEEKEIDEYPQKLLLKYDFNVPTSLNTQEVINHIKGDVPGNQEKVIDESDVTENLQVISNSSVLITNEIVEPIEISPELIPESSVHDEEDHIPNDELLTEEIVLENVESNLIEELQIIENINDQTAHEENIDDIHEVLENKVVEQTDIIERPDPKKLVRELIDLDPIYKSLLSYPKPFEQNEFFVGRKEIELPYLYNDSTLSENFGDVAHTSDEYTGTFEEDSKYDLDERDYDLDSMLLDGEENENYPPNKNDSLLISTENDLPTESIDINDTIDEIIKNKDYESEFANESTILESLDIDNDEKQEMKNLIEDDRLQLNDENEEEITEVFRDLSFLNNLYDEETIEQNNVKDDLPVEKNEDNYFERFKENENSDEDVKVISSTFQEFLSTMTMTEIIEAMFDYDMEDYYKLVGNISKTSNQKEAIEIANSYCKINHIDITNNEVKHFKNLITDYFSQSS